MRDGLGAEIGSVRDGLGAQIGSVRDGLADNRRHAQVLFESLQQDIRIVAEGLATLSAKLDARPR